MLGRTCLSLVFVALCAGTARGGGLEDCIKLSVPDSSDASFANGCADRLNVMYCVDNARSKRSCTIVPRDVTTLDPTASEVIAGYAADGGGALRFAVCAYPEAPVGWSGDAAGAYTCKKTCVMC